MTATRKSRASRSAEQAQQDQQQPEDELTEETEETEDEETEQQPEPEAAPELPVAVGGLGAGRITYHRPQLTLPSGEVIDCPHERWGHEKAPAAAKCLRDLARDNGVRVEAPES